MIIPGFDRSRSGRELTAVSESVYRWLENDARENGLTTSSTS